MMAMAESTRERDLILVPEIVFHWTPVHNQRSIIEDSLLVPGEKSESEGQKIKVVNGEALGKGIYTSTDPKFGRDYGCGARGAFLCLGLPGRQIQWKGKPGCLTNYDSLVNGSVRVYTSSDLLLPCFITEVDASQHLVKVLEEVTDILLEKAIRPRTCSQYCIGQHVEVLWSGTWWPGRIISSNTCGTEHTIAWARPYQDWQNDRKCNHELRPVAKLPA